MKLKRIIAEHLYNETIDNHSFDQLNSNEQDKYCRLAQDKIPEVLAGFYSGNGILKNIIFGTIKDFINIHGVTLNNQNYNSLAKRLVGNLRELK